MVIIIIIIIEGLSLLQCGHGHGQFPTTVQAGNLRMGALSKSRNVFFFLP